LASPEAVAERADSRRAYIDIDSAEAQSLLRDRFAEQLEAVDSDPGRFLSDAKLVRPLGEDELAATVSEDGDGQLLDAGIPVRTEDEDGGLRKVDLTLEPTSGGLHPANPLTDLFIPNSAAEQIEIGERGLGITPVGVREGETAQVIAGEDVLHHEVLEDTGLLVSPISAGVELFNILYSQESPEQLRYELDLPAGAELHATGEGGAQIMRAGETIATIPPPTAIDAQGTPVLVEMTIKGTSLSLHTSHRSEDLAYPIFVDPKIWENWYTSNWYGGAGIAALDTGAWQWETNSGGLIYGSTWPIYEDWGGSHRGLFISGPSRNWPPYLMGRWTYASPNTASYLTDVSILPFWRSSHGCNSVTYPHPLDFSGLWTGSAWNQVYYDYARYLNYSNHLWSNGEWGHYVMVGLNTWTGGNNPCWRDLYVGGASISLDDWTNPVISSITGLPAVKWIGSAVPINLKVKTVDEGLGVQRVSIVSDGKGVLAQDTVGGCTGLHGKRCPTGYESPLNITSDSFGEGVRNSTVSVSDPTGKTAESSFQTWIDRSKPVVNLDGQLADATEEDKGAEQGAEEVEKLRLPVYNLQIEATDIGTETDLYAKKRSGVKDIKVFLDGVEKPVPWLPTSSCPQMSCERKETYVLKLSEVQSAGLHKLEVRVTDFANNVQTRKVEFEYFPATGMKDEYVMHHFTLPDGGGMGEGSDQPELAVNVMNGNLVYRERDIDVDGVSVMDLKVERYYNSMLPNSENGRMGRRLDARRDPGSDARRHRRQSGARPGRAGRFQRHDRRRRRAAG
jgi:hypothetical protein